MPAHLPGPAPASSRVILGGRVSAGPEGQSLSPGDSYFFIKYGNFSVEYNNSAAKYGNFSVEYNNSAAKYGNFFVEYSNSATEYGNFSVEYNNSAAKYGNFSVEYEH